MVSSIVKQRYNITRLFAVLLSSYHCLCVCVRTKEFASVGRISH
jgi:hypothetical protein